MTFCRSILLFYLRQCLSSFGVSFSSVRLSLGGFSFPFSAALSAALSRLYVDVGAAVGGVFELTGATLAVSSSSNLTCFSPR